MRPALSAASVRCFSNRQFEQMLKLTTSAERIRYDAEKASREALKLLGPAFLRRSRSTMRPISIITISIVYVPTSRGEDLGFDDAHVEFVSGERVAK